MVHVCAHVCGSTRSPRPSTPFLRRSNPFFLAPTHIAPLLHPSRRIDTVVRLARRLPIWISPALLLHFGCLALLLDKLAPVSNVGCSSFVKGREDQVASSFVELCSGHRTKSSSSSLLEDSSFDCRTMCRIRIAEAHIRLNIVSPCRYFDKNFYRV